MSATALRTAEAQDHAAGLLRSPPQNLEAERALLGALLLNNRAFDKVADYLHADHFSDPVNARVYTAMVKLIELGHQANPVTLKTYLESDDLVSAAGGMKYLAALANSVVTVINAGDYGRLIYDLFLRRQLINLGEDMVNDAFEAHIDATAKEQIEGSEERLFQLAASGSV
jgi:replicative DNA helicase